VLNEHIDEPGDVVFRHVCKLGLEGIVSKRLGSPYRSGRSRQGSRARKSGGTGGETRGRRGLGKIAELFGPKYRNKAESKHNVGGTFLQRGARSRDL
jgi:hypothetical protein